MSKIAYDEKPRLLRVGLAEVFIGDPGVGVGLIESAQFESTWDNTEFEGGVPLTLKAQIRIRERGTVQFAGVQFNSDFLRLALPAYSAYTGGNLIRRSEPISFGAAGVPVNLDIADDLAPGTFSIPDGGGGLAGDYVRVHSGGSAPTVYVEGVDYSVELADATITPLVGGALVDEDAFVDYVYTDSEAIVTTFGGLQCSTAGFTRIVLHTIRPQDCVPIDIIVHKAQIQSPFTIAFDRETITAPNLTWTMFSDTTKALGRQLYEIIEGQAVQA